MRKTRTLLWVLGMLTLGVIARAGYLQIWGDPRIANLAKKQLYSKVLVSPRRGAILDRNGVPLVTNRETQSLAANPSLIKNKKRISNQLAKVLRIPANRLLKKFEAGSEFTWIKRHLSPEETKQLEKLGYFHAYKKDYDGFWLVKENQRNYPHGQLALPIVGRVNVDSEGLEGIELEKNEFLRGKTMKFSTVKDGLGRPAFLSPEVSQTTAQEGQDLNLSIDLSLQYSLESELKNSVEKYQAESAMGVVMSAENGEILALGQYPLDAEHLRNRVVSDGFEPGSVLKTHLYASALMHGLKPSDEVYGEKGVFQVQGKAVREAEAHEKFEWITLEHMLKVSSNIGAAKLGLKLGDNAYKKTLSEFGFGEKSGLSFPGEFTGKLPQGKWSQLTLANVSFGQGMMVSGLQMAASYAPFLNGGYWVKPRFTLGHGANEKRRVIDSVTAELVKQALVKVTDDGGTGTKARLEGFTVAGKTGTAQVVDQNTGKYSTSHYRSSFVGFAPELEQKVVIFVSVNRPKGVFYASEVAAPLFRQVLQSVVMRYGETPKTVSPAVLAEKIPESSPENVAESMPVVEKTSGTMPDLKGMTLREALRKLQTFDIQAEINGEGLVQSYSPPLGKTLAPKEVVRLNLSE